MQPRKLAPGPRMPRRDGDDAIALALALAIAIVDNSLLLTVYFLGAIHRRIMCGRYDYTPGEFREIRIRWNLDKDLPLFKPRYNIAPGKDVPVIVREGEHNQLKWEAPFLAINKRVVTMVRAIKE
jgi:hypothetical protein